MNQSDAIGTFGILLAVLAWMFPNALDPLKSWCKNWFRERNFSSLKEQLRATRRRIARLKRSKKPGKKAEDWIVVIASALSFLGIAIAGLAILLTDERFHHFAFVREGVTTFAVFSGFTILAIVMAGPNTSSPKHYCAALQRLQSKRNNLVKKVKDAETQ